MSGSLQLHLCLQWYSKKLIRNINCVLIHQKSQGKKVRGHSLPNTTIVLKTVIQAQRQANRLIEKTGNCNICTYVCIYFPKVKKMKLVPRFIPYREINSEWILFDFLKNIYLFCCAGSQLWHWDPQLQHADSWLQHVGSSSLTKNRTQAPCLGSMGSQALDHQGSPDFNLKKDKNLKKLKAKIPIFLNLPRGFVPINSS